MNVPYPHASPFGMSSPFDGPSLLDRYQGKPVGDIRFPKAATPQRPAVDPDYLAKTRENDPWPEGSSCAPPSDKPSATTPSVVLSNCRFLTPTDQLRFNEPFEMAVDVRRTALGKKRRAFFDLHQSWIRDGVREEQSIVRGIEGFPDSDGDTHTVKAKEVLETAMPYVLGETVEFWLTATHLEASEPATSPKVQVVLHHHAHWLGGSDIIFDLGSSFPRLGPDGRLASVLAAALKRTANPPHPENPESTICFGHASASGNADHNRKLSLCRAKVVKAILDRDEKAWETHAKEAFRTVDLQQFLADLAQSEGIGCDPGTIDGVNGPDTKSAVTGFQIHANATWNLGLEVDGDCGRRTWKAILRQILALVQQELGKDLSKAPEWKTPLWGHEGKGVYGNGEDFASAEENPDQRSVQIAFFAGGNEPILIDPPEKGKVTIKENPVEDAGQVRKLRIVLPVVRGTEGADADTGLPIFERHFQENHFCPSLLDDEFLSVIAGVIDFRKDNKGCDVESHPETCLEDPGVRDKRVQLADAILQGDESAWQKLFHEAAVSDVQTFLKYFSSKEWPCDPGAIDGLDGPKTKAAVRNFQAACNEAWGMSLSTDGICGPKTWLGVLRTVQFLVGGIGHEL
ncbi:MAG: peptidoglycan-binding protein [Fibrobacteria bacterium]|nr:peptidoglycan-binding protein [Fibrobacteria bacterium]